jgi:hypothetical protein
LIDTTDQNIAVFLSGYYDEKRSLDQQGPFWKSDDLCLTTLKRPLVRKLRRRVNLRARNPPSLIAEIVVRLLEPTG